MHRRKVAFPTSSHLTPIEAWQTAVSTTLEGRRLSSEARLENCTQVWVWAKFGQRATYSGGKIALHTCSDLPRLVQNYVQYSDHVRSSRNVIFCTFECSYSSVLLRILLKMHILTRLIEGFPTLYSSWSCIEVKLSIPPGAHAWRPSMERASSTVIF